MFLERRNTYLDRIETSSLSLFFSGRAPQKSADQFYPLTVNKNFFYLTGLDQENVVLLIAKGETTSDSYLFIEQIDPVKALWDGAGYTFEEASQISGIDIANIKPIETLDHMISQLLSTSRRALYGLVDKVYLDLERQNEILDPSLSIKYSHHLKDLFPHLQMKTNQMILAEMRTLKDEHEIMMTQKALDITHKGLNRIMETLKPGKFEYQIQAEYNFILNMHRTTPSFDTIAAGGKNATILHYVKNECEIYDGDLVLFDLGVNYNHYASDITRTFPANGKFSARQKAIYEVVLKANKDTIEWLRPGVTIKEFNEYGKKILIEGAKKLGLIEHDEDIQKYYYHSLGHYLGLDVHDGGNYSLPIPEGALITVEPGLYIAEEGIGIRIEDDIIVKKDGCINLSKAIIKEVKDIEDFMSRK